MFVYQDILISLKKFIKQQMIAIAGTLGSINFLSKLISFGFCILVQMTLCKWRKLYLPPIL